MAPPPLAQVNAAIVNGSPDATGIPIGSYGAICSAILIAPRTVLTSAHCLPWLAARCTTLATNPINVYFPEDGVPNPDNAAARTVGVQSVRVNPLAIADLSSCPSTPTCQTNALTCADRNANCPQTTPPAAVATAFVDRSNDHALLFLNADPPPDIQPMQVVVHPDYAKNSTSFVSFAGIETWALEQTPNVTIAGSGTGTSVYTSPTTGAQVTGKGAGISQWFDTLFMFGDRWTGCNQVVQGTLQPAIHLRSPDLTIASMNATWTCPPPAVQPAAYPQTCAPPGAQVPGANNSAAGPGDSGGPVLVGDDGSVYKTLQATPLPLPAAGDTYQLNRRYVAGLAEWNRDETNKEGNLVAGDAYTPTYTVQASFFLSSWLVDTDKDEIPDEADPFPTCSSNTDVDGDGVCDQEDICPCTALEQNPAFSDDQDGYCGPCDPALSGAVLPTGKTCAAWCTDFVHDLCPGVFDEYGNDNEDSERVWDARPLGNACDPVPVPDFVARWEEVIDGQVTNSGGSGTGNWFTTKKYVRASAIEHRLRGSFGAPDSAPGQKQTVVVPNTNHRYCLDKSIDGVVDISCKADVNVADSFLQLNLSRPQESLQTRWHRVSIQGLPTPGTGTFDKNPSLLASSYLTSPTAFTRSWFLVDDFNAWIPTSWGQSLGLDVPTSPNSWPGRFWLHSNSTVGLSTDIGTGLHRKINGDPGEQLSNHYELLNPVQLEDTTTAWDIPMYQPAFPWSFCPACTEEIPSVENDDCPMCKGLLPGSLLDSIYEPQLLVRMPAIPDFPFRFGIVLRDGSFVNVDERLGPNFKQALEDTSRVWAEQAEPLSYLGRGATLPTALALSSDGRFVSERVSFQGRRFLGQQDRGRLGVAGESGEPGEPVAFDASSDASLQDVEQSPGAREAFLPVYSRYLGRVFVVGGRDPATQAPRGDVWWQDAQGEATWHRVPDQGYSVNRVLATTYSFRDDRLWILDEVKGPGGLKRARLVRLDTKTGEFEQIGQWLRLGLFNQHWLVVDKDGQVLLAASSDVAKKHLVIRLDNRTSQVKPATIRLGQGALAYRPMVDQEGYSFVKRQMKKNKPPTMTERSKTLGGIPAAWSHLNGCW